MLQNKLIREDGTAITSSTIVSCQYTSSVNSQENLSVGDTTADEIKLEIRTPEKAISPGEKLTYYQVEDGSEYLIGVFYAEAPTIASRSTIYLNAYDGKAKLETDFSEWLNENQDLFPLPLRNLVEKACTVAGVSLSAESFTNENIEIPAFYADGVTCREIVGWAAQISGCFVLCNNAGEICFGWYQPSSFSVDKTSYAENKLSRKSYTTDLIKRVQFKQDTNDVGVIYPPDAEGNVFSISLNGLAALLDSDTLLEIAESLFEKLKSITYTPVDVRLLKRTRSVKAGDIITVSDGNGETVSTYVMQVCTNAYGTQITSTGEQSYSEKAAVASEKYANIPGRVLSIEKSVDGLHIENANTAGAVASLELTVDSVQSQVSAQKTELGTVQKNVTQLQQNADQVLIRVESIETDGVSKVKTAMGYTFDDDGLTISRDGEQIKNTLDHEGMTVKRGDEIMLSADKDGVIATDVKVRNYLIIGQHARVEDYSNGSDTKRTAVFWISGEDS